MDDREAIERLNQRLISIQAHAIMLQDVLFAVFGYIKTLPGFNQSDFDVILDKVRSETVRDIDSVTIDQLAKRKPDGPKN